jgi:ABC-2 type transport system permease protein
MNKIITIVDKEWSEVFRNPLVLLTVALLPLLFTVLPLVVLYFMQGPAGASSGTITDMPPQFTAVCGDLNGGDCTQVYVINQFLMLFMMLPLLIPAAISAYSIVGEKTTRCLEPLLATPISTAQLIAGKAAAAAIPAIVATLGGFAIFAVGSLLIVHNPVVSARIVEPRWLVAILVLGPLMAIATVNVSIMVSSRVSDPRTAEQLSMVVLVPLLGVFFAQMAGVLLLDMRFMLVSALVLGIVDVGLIYLGAAAFQRETILTRWK